MKKITILLLVVFIVPFVSGYSVYYGDYNENLLEKHIDVPVAATSSDMKFGLIGVARIGLIKGGNGKIIFDQRTYVDKESISSIINAIRYAESVTNQKKYDYFISYDLMSEKVSGKSSSSSIALGIIELFTDTKLNNTLITGEIDSRGNLMETGGLPIKIQAAGAHGIKKMYIPLTQEKIDYYEKNGRKLLKKELDLVEMGHKLDINILGIKNLNEVIKQKV